MDESVQIIVLTPPCSPKITVGPALRGELPAGADTADDEDGTGDVLASVEFDGRLFTTLGGG